MRNVRVSKHRRNIARKRMMLLLVTVLFITVGSIVFGSCFSSAQDSDQSSQQQYKYYKSIEIKAGDSLWNIAKEYRTDAYDSTQEYVNELIILNNLSSEYLQEGQHLLVAYYEQEFK